MCRRLQTNELGHRYNAATTGTGDKVSGLSRENLSVLHAKLQGSYTIAPEWIYMCCDQLREQHRVIATSKTQHKCLSDSTRTT